MKMFIDMEFTGLHQNTTPISLALRAHDGHEFYAEFTDYDLAQINPWIQEHVIANLIIPTGQSENAGEIGTVFCKGRRDVIAYNLSAWLDGFNDITIVGDCLAYDWVLFCELFENARLPGHVNYIPIDLSTVLAINAVDPDISREAIAEEVGYYIHGTKHNALHNALHDVRVMAAIWDFLEFHHVRHPIQVPASFFRDMELGALA